MPGKNRGAGRIGNFYEADNEIVQIASTQNPLVKNQSHEMDLIEAGKQTLTTCPERKVNGFGKHTV